MNAKEAQLVALSKIRKTFIMCQIMDQIEQAANKGEFSTTVKLSTPELNEWDLEKHLYYLLQAGFTLVKHPQDYEVKIIEIFWKVRSPDEFRDLLS